MENAGLVEESDGKIMLLVLATKMLMGWTNSTHNSFTEKSLSVGFGLVSVVVTVCALEVDVSRV